jgi:hypothetical protein
MPRPSPQSTIACQRPGRPARIASAWAMVQGTILLLGWCGSFTDCALHGLRVISWSSTAALRIVDSVIATWGAVNETGTSRQIVDHGCWPAASLGF